jgi:hypothetical protein
MNEKQITFFMCIMACFAAKLVEAQSDSNRSKKDLFQVLGVIIFLAIIVTCRCLYKGFQTQVNIQHGEENESSFNDYQLTLRIRRLIRIKAIKITESDRTKAKKKKKKKKKKQRTSFFHSHDTYHIQDENSDQAITPRESHNKDTTSTKHRPSAVDSLSNTEETVAAGYSSLSNTEETVAAGYSKINNP